MTINIPLSQEEKKLIESYMKIHSLSLEEALKNALIEKIEDEYDAMLADEAYEEYLRNPVTYSHDEIWDIIDQELEEERKKEVSHAV